MPLICATQSYLCRQIETPLVTLGVAASTDTGANRRGIRCGAFATMTRERADAVSVVASVAHRSQQSLRPCYWLELATKHRLPIDVRVQGECGRRRSR